MRNMLLLTVIITILIISIFIILLIFLFTIIFIITVNIWKTFASLHHPRLHHAPSTAPQYQQWSRQS